MLITQPQGGPLEVDWESPITAGLSAAHVLGYAKRFDAVRRVATSATGTKTNTVAGGLTSGFGAALGVGASDRVPTPYNKALTSRSTFFAGVRNGAGGGNLGRIYDKTSGSAGQFLYWSNTAILLQYGYFLGGSEQIVQIPGTGTTCAVGVPFTVLVTHNVVGTSQTINAWVNGNQVLTNATATGTMNDAAATVLSIGNRADGIRGWDGSIECGFVWDRILTADEAKALHAARYQIFVDEDEEDEILFAPAVVGTTTGALAWAEQDDACSITGTRGNAATLGWVESSDGCAATATLTNGATIGWAEADDATAIAASVLSSTSISLGWVETDDVLAMTGAVLVEASGALSWAEQDDATAIAAQTAAPAGHGFEMVSMEPTWKRAIRLRHEAKQVDLSRKKRKRAELIEKLAAKEVMSVKPDAQIETRIKSLLAEWVDLAPKLELKPVAQVPAEDAYQAFMARVAEHVRRLEDEDDEHAAEMLLLM